MIYVLFNPMCRYYIRPESLEFKIPAVYPCSGLTRNIVSTVAAGVMGGIASIASATGQARSAATI